MNYEAFVREVESRLQDPRPGEAESAIRATLETLGERISRGEAEDIAAQLPDRLAIALTRPGGEAEDFGLDASYRRVAEKEGIEIDEATEHVAAVMTVLRQAISESELRDVRSQLPQEFYPLLHG
jgi:uncharacterized protein (DUF2267 family)